MFASSLKFKTFISKFGHIKVSKYGGWCSYQSARKSVMIISQLLCLSVLLFFFSLFFFCETDKLLIKQSKESLRKYQTCTKKKTVM